MSTVARKHEESDLLAAIREALVRCGCTCWRNNTGVATYAESKVRYGLGVGSADLVGIYKGRFIAVEVKAEKGRQSPEQKAWQACVERAGGLYVLARSVEEALFAVIPTLTKATQ
jgi:hypothetical protein